MLGRNRGCFFRFFLNFLFSFLLFSFYLFFCLFVCLLCGKIREIREECIFLCVKTGGSELPLTATHIYNRTENKTAAITYTRYLLVTTIRNLFIYLFLTFSLSPLISTLNAHFPQKICFSFSNYFAELSSGKKTISF